jgi:hypothetical protein
MAADSAPWLRDEPAMPPSTAPVAPPAPLWLPSTVTLRTDSTVASCTLARRCASPRWTTSGLVVVQAARVAIAAAAIRVLMSMLSSLGVPAQRRVARGG